MNKKRFLMPIYIFISYIIITLGIHLLGPWRYQNNNQIIVTLFITVFLILTFFSFYIGISGWNKSSVENQERISKGSFNYKRVQLLILLGFIVMVIVIILKITESGLPVGKNIYSIMAEAYTNKVYQTGINKSAWVLNYFSFFYVSSFILGLYYFKEISLAYKILWLSSSVIYLLYNILYVGNQKAIGDIIIYVLSIILIRLVSRKKIPVKGIIISTVVILIAIIVFSNVLVNRMIYWGVEYYSVGNQAFLDTDNWLLKYLPTSEMKLGFGTLLYYVSSGYYGLGMSLNLPFKWSFGYGSSFAVKEIFNKFIFVDESIIGAYPVRMQNIFGWDAYSNWHTIFPWLASDFTYIGALIFLSVVVYIYGVSWKNILLKKHWSNILLFSQINILLAYIPANNQLFQTRSSLICTIIIVLLWLKYRNVQGGEVKIEKNTLS